MNFETWQWPMPPMQEEDYTQWEFIKPRKSSKIDYARLAKPSSSAEGDYKPERRRRRFSGVQPVESGQEPETLDVHGTPGDKEDKEELEKVFMGWSARLADCGMPSFGRMVGDIYSHVSGEFEKPGEYEQSKGELQLSSNIADQQRRARPERPRGLLPSSHRPIIHPQKLRSKGLESCEAARSTKRKSRTAHSPTLFPCLRKPEPTELDDRCSESKAPISSGPSRENRQMQNSNIASLERPIRLRLSAVCHYSTAPFWLDSVPSELPMPGNGLIRTMATL